MKNLQNSFLRGWKLFLLLYLVLLFSSYLFETLSTTSQPAVFPNLSNIDRNEKVIVFPDLEYESKELSLIISELIKTNDVLVINYTDTTGLENNFSAASYARKLRTLFNSDEYDSLHVIGNGFGAVFASNFVLLNDNRIESLILLDPEGILEFELLGGHILNSSVYSAAKIVYWGLNNLIPDFGAFSKSHFNTIYPQVRLDTDLRIEKKIFSSINVPTLIATTNDNDINLSQSKEFKRLLLNSEQVIFNKDDTLFLQKIRSFISDTTDKKNEISVSKKIKSILPFTYSNISGAKGWVLVGLIILIILSTFISEDLACIGAGLMVARGLMSFTPAVAACFIGIFVGDTLVYLSGKWLGKNAASKIPFKWFISEMDIKRSNLWFKQKGPVIIIISRFIPGTRFPTYFTAGVIGASFWMFIFYFGVASLIWTPAIVSLSILLGNELIYYFSLYQDYAMLVIGSVLLFIFLTLKILIPLFTYRGRRLLFGKYKRLLNWEFWHPFFLYTPVVLYVFILWLKFKKLTVVTAANPGIEEGGFKGESKINILEALGPRNYVAKTFFLNLTQNTNELKADSLKFMDHNAIDFPVILKPNKGERGKGVDKINNASEFEDKLKSCDEDYLLQEFIQGSEFGIFYYRYPDKKNGEIFSITRKVKLILEGDGIHSLEELILKDSRAVCLAETHFNKHIEILGSIPEKNKKIELVDIGTHSGGAIFLDGSDLITPDLSVKIDEIIRNFEGFYFGRFDVIAKSEEDLKKGKNFRIIELNGVTSESTNIYDPKFSYFKAVKVLLKQWKIAYEIGSINYNNGTKIPSLKHMTKILFDS
jgi:membrane protein DedA with SNARE-associated domain